MLQAILTCENFLFFCGCSARLNESNILTFYFLLLQTVALQSSPTEGKMIYQGRIVWAFTITIIVFCLSTVSETLPLNLHYCSTTTTTTLQPLKYFQLF
jgi:hypothetical protein